MIYSPPRWGIFRNAKELKTMGKQEEKDFVKNWLKTQNIEPHKSFKNIPSYGWFEELIYKFSKEVKLNNKTKEEEYIKGYEQAIRDVKNKEVDVETYRLPPPLKSGGFRRVS